MGRRSKSQRRKDAETRSKPSKPDKRSGKPSKDKKILVKPKKERPPSSDCQSSSRCPSSESDEDMNADKMREIQDAAMAFGL